MLLPYKVKNPIKGFPYITISLIVLNVIVYALTTNYFISIREEVVKGYAFALGISPFYTFFTAVFLHGDIFHLLGNMLFLWIFGPPVEERLGRFKYLGLYLVTGFAGSLLQSALDTAFLGTVQPCIGASGCIMGVAGAYLYLFPWSTVCVAYYFYYIYHGVWEIQALWVIGAYVVINIAEGLFSGAAGIGGGVANFAHVGGALAGVLICLALRAKRDTEALSEAKASQANMRGLDYMSLYDLQTMLEADPGDPKVIRAMVPLAMKESKLPLIESAMAQAGVDMITKDPTLVAYYIADLGGDASFYPSLQLLRLAGQMERTWQPQLAMGIYRIIFEQRTSDAEAETALYRAADCSFRMLSDTKSAREYLATLGQRYPRGEMLPYGRALMRRIEEKK